MQIREAAKVRNRQSTWYVIGDSGTEYTIHNKRHQITHRKFWTCNCPDFTERKIWVGEDCKHIVEVKIYLQRKAAEAFLASAQVTAATPATTDLKTLLNQIIEFFNLRNDQSALLWNILSALRGPDNGSIALKDFTTARLRHALGLQHSAQFVISSDPLPGIDRITNPLFPKFIAKEHLRQVIRDQFPRDCGEISHFVSHFVNAVIALKELGYFDKKPL